MNRTRVWVVVLAAALLAGPMLAAAQPAAPAADKSVNGQVILSWDEFVKITGYDPVKGSQSLTIPWPEVERLLGVELKGKVGMDKTTVDLPWQDFKALLEWSIKRQQGDAAPPPTDYVITASEYAGTLGDQSAKLTRKLTVNVLRQAGWKRIPILPLGVAVTASKLPDGVFLNSTGSGYELLTTKSGELAVTVDFTARVVTDAGVSRMSVPAVQAASSVLDLTIDSDKVDAKVPEGQAVVTKAADGKTHVAAALPAGASLDVWWERAVAKVAAAPTRLYAETRTLVAVSEGILLCQETVNYSILHTAVRDLKLTVPQGVAVLEVLGRNIMDWRVEKDGTMTVALRGEVIGGYDLRISYELAADKEVTVPVIRSVGAEREKGYVGVVALTNVEIDAPKVEGAAAIDVKQLPAEIVAMTKQPLLLAFRYVGEKFAIPLEIKRHGEVTVLVTIADSGLFTIMQLADGRRMTRAIYTVRNNRNQFLRVAMPAGADIWSVAVSGNPVTPAKDSDGKVLIPMIRSAVGAELSSFPVEVVYVETPAKPAPAKGTMHVDLPTLDCPTMHVMATYYAPAEGKYGRPAVFGSGTSGFTGTLHLVEDFATMMTDANTPRVVQEQAAQQAQQMQETFSRRTEDDARAAGVTPIRVSLPIGGRQFRLEKILALVGDKLEFDVEYRDWDAAK
ncbi:MAG: hypothetical protein BIFFINMI_01036 [Phycisphaerae bacterium]|nr:hypothetical protein [Phycisphaerae bacterium]